MFMSKRLVLCSSCFKLAPPEDVNQLRPKTANAVVAALAKVSDENMLANRSDAPKTPRAKNDLEASVYMALANLDCTVEPEEEVHPRPLLTYPKRRFGPTNLKYSH